MPLAHEVYSRLRRPELLLLAGLFHDIAKGRGGDHSELGEVDAREFCARLGCPRRMRDLVGWLVRQHLVMSVTAQKQDITDPRVVHRFAGIAADIERLDHLYLLTVADIRATSPKLWNSWKDRLLAELYQRTHYALARGLEHPVHARPADRRDAAWRPWCCWRPPGSIRSGSMRCGRSFRRTVSCATRPTRSPGRRARILAATLAAGGRGAPFARARHDRAVRLFRPIAMACSPPLRR